MLVACCKLERRQAIVKLGIQPFVFEIPDVGPNSGAACIPINSYRALIDTGAQRSCLTKRTIEAERLVRHGHKLIRNVHSQATHSLYMATIGIFGVAPHDRWSTDSGLSYFGLQHPIEFINIEDNASFDAILGMDVLENFTFTFTKEGAFELNLV
jgi:hypothetical protein